MSQGISFAAMLGVNCISEVLSLCSVVDAPEPDNELLEFVWDNILYVQCFVKKRYLGVYASLGQEFAAALAGFRAFTASRVSGMWCIDGDRETNPILYDTLLDRKHPVLPQSKEGPQVQQVHAERAVKVLPGQHS